METRSSVFQEGGERERESSPAFCEFSRAWGCTVPRNQDVIGGNKRGRREFNVALLLLLLLPSNKGCFLDFVSSSLREGDPRWMGVMIMNEACLEKRDASCVLIQDARRDTRRMITRDEKCLIRCVFRKEMVVGGCRGEKEVVFSFRLSFR